MKTFHLYITVGSTYILDAFLTLAAFLFYYEWHTCCAKNEIMRIIDGIGLLTVSYF